MHDALCAECTDDIVKITPSTPWFILRLVWIFCLSDNFTIISFDMDKILKYIPDEVVKLENFTFKLL